MAHKFELPTADSLIQRLVDAGVLPNNCRRFVIDCEVGEVPTMYFECFGDERLSVVLRDAALMVEARPAGSEQAGERAGDPPAQSPREGFEL
jgi:hypothetical protein